MAVNPRAMSGVSGDTQYTHLNTAADTQKGTLSPYTGSTFIYALTGETSDRLIKVLQDFFNKDTLCRELNAKLGKVNKEVTVVDQYMIDTVGLPQIVVSSNPVDNIADSLGDRIGQEEYESELFYVYGGRANVNTTIELYDSGKPNVENLADLVFLGLMHFVYYNMMQTMMFIEKPKIRFSNATRSTTTAGGEVYQIKLTVPIQTQWRQYFKIDTIDIDKIEQSITKNV
jgi:hypothetical protein